MFRAENQGCLAAKARTVMAEPGGATGGCAAKARERKTTRPSTAAFTARLKRRTPAARPRGKAMRTRAEARGAIQVRVRSTLPAPLERFMSRTPGPGDTGGRGPAG